MTFVFEITRPLPLGTVVARIRNPEFGDVDQFSRRQATGLTEGGRLFVQDLGVDEQFYLATWSNLTRCEKADLEHFFSAPVANKRLRPFTLRVEDNLGKLAFRTGTGQGWNTGDPGGCTPPGCLINTGDWVVPPMASFGTVRLDQSDLSFTAIPRDRFNLSLRFRILNPTPC